jgi:hypothetical protein
MSRIRTIKPEFFLHEGLFDAEMESKLPLRLSFQGLWIHSDREGRFEWRPRALKAGILPYDEVDFSRVLDALSSRGFILKYEHEGKLYGWIPSFTTHQVINNKERASALPEPTKESIINSNLSTRDARVLNACLTPLSNSQGERNMEHGKGKEEEGNSLSARARDMNRKMALGPICHFGRFRELYPKPGNWLEAEIVWRQKKCDEEAEKIFADVPKRQAEDAHWQESRFIPNPENYLKREVWKNAIVPKSTQSDDDRFVQATPGCLAKLREQRQRDELARAKAKQSA